MSRVDYFQREYPTIPREVILKLDVIRHGLKDTAALHRAGNWMRSLGTYQNYDHDNSLKDAAQMSQRLQAGFVKMTFLFYFKNGLSVHVMRNSSSPYEVRDLGFGRFALYEEEEQIDEVYFLRDPRPWPEEPRTTKGTPVTSLVTLYTPQCVMISPVRYCEYFASGEQCKFCNFNGGQADARAIGLNRATTIDPEEAVEAYKTVAAETRIKDLRLECGGLRNDGQKLKVLLNFAERLTGAAAYKPNLTVRPEPLTRKDFQRLKDVGVDCVSSQMEVWDPQIFAEVCPGKAKYTGYERYKESILEAKEIMGAGNVGTNFVGGVTLLPANGHKTWQEARDSMIEGVRWLISNGILPTVSPIRLGPGSVYGDDQSLKEKRAPTEYYLDISLAHHESMLESDFYTKLNRFLNCPFECTAMTLNADIGMVALYGDIRNWLENKPLVQMHPRIGKNSE